MRILIVTPSADGAPTGNVASAEQWRMALASAGHEVEVRSGVDGETADVLIALNAEKSRAEVEAFRERVPGGKVVVALTGTDIYPEPAPGALDSMRWADRLVALQPKAAEQVPPELRPKVSVIVQGVTDFGGELGRGGDTFDVALVANLREVKDPLLAAAAARLVPAGSKLRLRHAGAVLDERYRRLAEQELVENPRYEWLGALAPEAARQLIAECKLLVLTSRSEGAGRVVGEAISVGVPVLSTRVDGVVGLLGEGYPGFFPVGDDGALAELLNRAENDATFMADLHDRCRALAPQFEPGRERRAWSQLIDELAGEDR